MFEAKVQGRGDPPQSEGSKQLYEPLYTPEELARATKLHAATIRKIFMGEQGVIRLGRPTLGRRRQYFTLRIPESVARRVLARMTVNP
jgi:hypothetical protein